MFLVDRVVGEITSKARAAITAVRKVHETTLLNLDNITPNPAAAVRRRDKALLLVMVLEAVIISVMDLEAEDIRKRTAKPTGAARQTSNTAMTAKAISGTPLKVPHPLHATTAMLLHHVTTLMDLPHATGVRIELRSSEDASFRSKNWRANFQKNVLDKTLGFPTNL
jgi:hypothetical protein